MKTVKIAHFLALFALLAFGGCSSAQHISRFDQSIVTGLTTARTALNSYLPDNPIGHEPSAAFYSNESAEFSTLIAQARATPLNDSATTSYLLAADSALAHLQTVEFTFGDTVASHLLFFRNVINDWIDDALAWEAMKPTN